MPTKFMARYGFKHGFQSGAGFRASTVGHPDLGSKDQFTQIGHPRSEALDTQKARIEIQVSESITVLSVLGILFEVVQDSKIHI